MIRYSSSVTINRPPRDVYQFLLDPRRYSEWTPMVDMRYDDTREPEVGGGGSFRLERGPLKGSLAYRITELDEQRQIVWQIAHPAADWMAIARLMPDGQATRLEYGGEIRLRGWRRLLEPLLAAETRAGEGREVQRLKELLEMHAPVPASATA